MAVHKETDVSLPLTAPSPGVGVVQTGLHRLPEIDLVFAGLPKLRRPEAVQPTVEPLLQPW